MRIIVSGGGTAGHVTPTLAVIEALEEKVEDLELMYIGSKEGIESVIIPKVGICFESISTGKIRRYHSNLLLNILDPTTIFKNIRDIFRLGLGIFEASKKLKRFSPEAIFLKGGYVSVPVGIAAKLLKIPFVLHESDIVPGLANKILSKYASKVCISFPEEYLKEYFSKEKMVYTGNPIRNEVLKGDRTRGLEKFKLKEKVPVILVIGGSQGALKINKLIEGCLEDFLHKYQLIHITGEYSYDWIDFRAKNLAKDLKENYRYFDFLSSDLKDAYAVSDIIITRAGCNVLTEIAALKKPSILIPLTGSAQNHQFKNALLFSRDGAAYVMDEQATTSRELLRQVEYVLENKGELEMMSKKAGNFYKANSASEIAEEVLKNKIILNKDNKKNAKKEKAKRTVS